MIPGSEVGRRYGPPMAGRNRRVDEDWRPVIGGVAMVVTTIVAGTVGFTIMGFSVLDALYQTITTITTVGFREVHRFGTAEKLFTIPLVLIGVASALYTFGAVFETVLEGRLSQTVGRRRMNRRISELHDHVIVCGWGRVGQTVGAYVAGRDDDVVVVDRDPARTSGLDLPFVVGDATDDEVLRQAGIGRAKALIAALTTDADNLFVTLSARGLRPDLFIVARARFAGAEPKLEQAGADRVVNPQQIGGARMAAMALQPHVAEFLDVVMHDGSLEFRLEELTIPVGSALEGQSLRQSELRDRTGALVLALREGSGAFTTNPSADTVLHAGQVIIAVGTAEQLDSLEQACALEQPH